MSSFSETMKRLRAERNMSQEEFAAFLGTSKQNISRYENGEVSPKISTAAKMAEKLGITLSEINGVEAPPASKHTSESVLTPLEARLLSSWRQLNQAGQENLADYADTLVASGKYAKTPAHVSA